MRQGRRVTPIEGEGGKVLMHYFQKVSLTPIYKTFPRDSDSAA